MTGNLRIVKSSEFETQGDILSSMHRLRHLCFVQKLKWESDTKGPVYGFNGMEFDQYDDQHSVYLVFVEDDNQVTISCRLKPADTPNLICHSFPDLLENYNGAMDGKVWEISRLCYHPSLPPVKSLSILASGLSQFSVMNDLDNYISMTDVRFEKLFKKVGFHFERISSEIVVGEDTCVGEKYVVSKQQNDNLIHLLSNKYKMENDNILLH